MFIRNIIKLQGLSNLPYFTVGNAAEALGIQTDSASVFCSATLRPYKNRFCPSNTKPSGFCV